MASLIKDQKGLAPVITIIVLFFSIILGVVLIQQKTNIFPKAQINEPPQPETSFTLFSKINTDARYCAPNDCPDGTINVGETFPVNVLVRSDLEAANAFEARIGFDTNALEVTSITVKGGVCLPPPPCEGGILLHGDPRDEKSCPVYYCSKPDPKPQPPSGCFFEEVKCVQTPCEPRLVCPNPRPIPEGCYYENIQCVQAPCEPRLVCPTPSVRPMPVPSDKVCADVVTRACRNRSSCTAGGACTDVGPECREFNSPCEVPEGWYIDSSETSGDEQVSASPVYCPSDVKQCPDGSWVGRSGPSCEFAACSTIPMPTDPGVLCGGPNLNQCPDGMFCHFNSNPETSQTGVCVSNKNQCESNKDCGDEQSCQQLDCIYNRMDCHGENCSVCPKVCVDTGYPVPPVNPYYFIKNWIQNEYSNENGKITLVGGVPSPGFRTKLMSEHGVMATIIFKAKKAGVTEVFLSDDSSIFSNKTNQNILTTKRNTNITVADVVTKKGDLNNDGRVNILDLALLIGKWAGNDAAADLNGDGKVGIADLSILLSNWGS